jgi:hypothetical protein
LLAKAVAVFLCACPVFLPSVALDFLQGFLGDFDLAGIEKKEGAEERRGNRGTSDWKASWEDQDQGAHVAYIVRSSRYNPRAN